MNNESPSPPSCLIPGLNSKGIATTLKGRRPVEIDYIDHGSGFYFVRDLEHDIEYRVFRTDFTMSQSIPSKFREHHFQSLAHIWAEALTAFPSIIKVSVGHLSGETVARKLREAREAKNTYKWKFPTIDEEAWELNAYKIAIEPVIGGVLVGPLVSKRKFKIVNSSTEFYNTPTRLRIQVGSKAEHHEQICKLLNDKALNPKPIFVLSGLDDERVNSLQDRYDVGLTETTDKGVYEIL